MISSKGVEHILARDFNEFLRKLSIFLKTLDDALVSLPSYPLTLTTLFRVPESRPLPSQGAELGSGPGSQSDSLIFRLLLCSVPDLSC